MCGKATAVPSISPTTNPSPATGTGLRGVDEYKLKLAHSGLIDAFDWSSSVEGHAYWDEVHERLSVYSRGHKPTRSALGTEYAPSAKQKKLEQTIEALKEALAA